MKRFLNKMGHIKCAKEPRCSSWNHGFFSTIIGRQLFPSL